MNETFSKRKTKVTRQFLGEKYTLRNLGYMWADYKFNRKVTLV